MWNSITSQVSLSLSSPSPRGDHPTLSLSGARTPTAPLRPTPNAFDPGAKVQLRADLTLPLTRWSQSLQHWPQKVVLLVVLYLIAPTPRAADPIPTAIEIASTVAPTHSSPALDSPNSKVQLHLRSFTSARPVVGRASEPAEAGLTLGDSDDRKAAEATQVNAHDEPAPHSVHLRKQTSHVDLDQVTGAHSTPPLSPPPPAPSVAPRKPTPLNDERQARTNERPTSDDDEPTLTVEFEECEVDERGRPRCPGTTRLPLSLSDRRNELADAVHEFGLWFVGLIRSAFYEFSLSPLAITIFLFHLLLAIQVSAQALEDLIVRTDIGAPPLSEFPRGDTLGKRLNRIRWKAVKTFKRHARAITTLSLLLGMTGWIAHESWHKGQGRGAWDDAPFERWLLKSLEEGAECTVKCKRSPYRELVLLECVSTVLALLQPIKHLIPASVLPPTLAAPKLLLAQQPPAPASAQPSSSSTNQRFETRLDSLWLADHALLALSSLISIVQALGLVLLLPSYSPLALPVHLLFYQMRSSGQELAALRNEVRRTVECLETVLRLFPAQERESTRREASGVSEEDEFLCTICFEGVGEVGGKTADLQCSLSCGHQFHAGCISKWLYRQSWCPCCHLPLVPPTAQPNIAHHQPPPTLPPILLPPEPDESDLFPGMRRRAAEMRANPFVGQI